MFSIPPYLTLCRREDRRKKPLAPTCRICLIRDDLTTVWCEVTSSIRDRSADEESGEEKTMTLQSSGADDITEVKHEQTEILLCLRPIREGELKVDESRRFYPRTRKEISTGLMSMHEAMVSTSSGDANEKTGSSSSNSNEVFKRPPKKRTLTSSRMDSLSTNDDLPQKKRSKSEGYGQSSNGSDTEKSVVESLMLMNKSSQ